MDFKTYYESQINEGIFQKILLPAALALSLLGNPAYADQKIHATGLSNNRTLPTEFTATIKGSFENIKVGDYVSYKHKDGIRTIHQVFKQLKDRNGNIVWWARGTGNRMPDTDYITKDNFLGILDMSTIKPCKHGHQVARWR